MMIRSRLLFVFCGVLGAAATKLTVCVLDIVNLPHTDGGFWAPDPCNGRGCNGCGRGWCGWSMWGRVWG